jgi:hypothetical protein
MPTGKRTFARTDPDDVEDFANDFDAPATALHAAMLSATTISAKTTRESSRRVTRSR